MGKTEGPETEVGGSVRDTAKTILDSMDGLVYNDITNRLLYDRQMQFIACEYEQIAVVSTLKLIDRRITMEEINDGSLTRADNS